tara:strand:+ start:714 stop:968 length:255 start_codon:yes stop_codon:yes gene_type:complete
MKNNYLNEIPIPDDVDITISLKEWSKISGVKLSTLQKRIKDGWDIKEVLYRKVRFNKNNKSQFNPKIHTKVGEISEGLDFEPFN